MKFAIKVSTLWRHLYPENVNNKMPFYVRRNVINNLCMLRRKDSSYISYTYVESGTSRCFYILQLSGQ